MKLLSQDFEENEAIPSKFTCDGEDICPQLHWEDVPEKTRSFALTMTDPDAPGGTFIHWLVHDIPKDIRVIERGGLPMGAKQVKNDFGKERYGGSWSVPPFRKGDVVLWHDRLARIGGFMDERGISLRSFGLKNKRFTQAANPNDCTRLFNQHVFSKRESPQFLPPINGVGFLGGS